MEQKEDPLVTFSGVNVWGKNYLTMYDNILPDVDLKEDYVYLMCAAIGQDSLAFVPINPNFDVNSTYYSSKEHAVGFVNRMDEEAKPVYYDGTLMSSEDYTTAHVIFTCFTYSKEQRKCKTRYLENVGGILHADNVMVPVDRIMVLEHKEDNFSGRATETFLVRSLVNYIPVDGRTVHSIYREDDIIDWYSDALAVVAKKLNQDHNDVIFSEEEEIKRPLSLVRISGKGGRTIYVYPFTFWHLLEEVSPLYRSEYGCEEDIVELPESLFSPEGLRHDIALVFLRMLATNKVPNIKVLRSLGVRELRNVR